MGGIGSGGHNRKSVWQHIFEGTYKPSRHGPRPDFNELEMPMDIKPPRWFPDEAKAYFEQLAPQLWKLGTLDMLSLRLFEILCFTLARQDTLERILASEGEVVKDKLHPLTRIYYQYSDEALRLFRIFGMTPMARHELGLGKVNEN
jgi:P27 family predicted phage terminase small subunit